MFFFAFLNLIVVVKKKRANLQKSQKEKGQTYINHKKKGKPIEITLRANDVDDNFATKYVKHGDGVFTFIDTFPTLGTLFQVMKT